MALNPLVKPVAIIAGVLGIVQGQAWIILSLFVMLIYLEVWDPFFRLSWTHGKALQRTMIWHLTGLESSEVLVTSKGLFVWSFVCFFTSVIWIGISLALLRVIMYKKYSSLKNRLVLWAGWTGVICFCDLILTILLGSDYNTFLARANEALWWGRYLDFYYDVLIRGILMTLAAKGFVLWIINLTFLISLAHLSNHLMEEEQQNFNDTNITNLPAPIHSPRLHYMVTNRLQD